MIKDRKDEVQDIRKLHPYQITALGWHVLSRISGCLKTTVLDNVWIANHLNVEYNTLDAVLRLPKYYQEEERIEEQSMELLKIFNIEAKSGELAKTYPMVNNGNSRSCGLGHQAPYLAPG